MPDDDVMPAESGEMDPATPTDEGQEPDGLADGQEGEPGDVETQDEDLEEIEHEGRKIKVPKGIKDALLRHEDYTRKTQEVAEQRRALEAEQQSLAQHAQAQRESLEDIGRIKAMDMQLEQYAGVNWQAFTREDPMAAQQAYMAFQDLKGKREALIGQVGQREQTRRAQVQQEQAKRTAEGQARLAKEIPGWSPEKARELSDYAVKSLGFSEAEVKQVYDPRLVKLLHLAALGDKLSKAATKQPKPATEAKPVPTVRGGARAPVDESKLNDEDWMRRRHKRR